jgi:hypothetical protein
MNNNIRQQTRRQSYGRNKHSVRLQAAFIRKEGVKLNRKSWSVRGADIGFGQTTPRWFRVSTQRNTLTFVSEEATASIEDVWDAGHVDVAIHCILNGGLTGLRWDHQQKPAWQLAQVGRPDKSAEGMKRRVADDETHRPERHKQAPKMKMHPDG